MIQDSTQDIRQTPLTINDMSLEFGGLFDISGQWRTPHNSHRTGRDVDIENIQIVILMLINQESDILIFIGEVIK